jgi:hypothetical protein
VPVTQAPVDFWHRQEWPVLPGSEKMKYEY